MVGGISLRVHGDVHHLVSELHLRYFDRFLHVLRNLGNLSGFPDSITHGHSPLHHDRDVNSPSLCLQLQTCLPLSLLNHAINFSVRPTSFLDVVYELQLRCFVCDLHLLNRGYVVLHCRRQVVRCPPPLHDYGFLHNVNCWNIHLRITGRTGLLGIVAPLAVKTGSRELPCARVRHLISAPLPDCWQIKSRDPSENLPAPVQTTPGESERGSHEFVR